MSDPRLSIAVFGYNEVDNVPTVLAELRQWLEAEALDAEVIFVDDGSTDGTGDAARSALATVRHVLVRHARNRGIGAALKSAVRAATGTWVTFLPADGQIPPSAIGVMLEAAEECDADVVLSVYDHRDDGPHRAVLSWGVRALITLVHGVRLRSDGPYLFRRRLFDPEQLPSDTFFLNFEFPLRALRAGLHTTTVTIPCRPRRAGHSKSTAARRVAGVARDLASLRLRGAREGIARATGRRPAGRDPSP